ncbi:MAG: hypothetical protein ACLR43_01790 [Faecalibacillus faecis]
MSGVCIIATDIILFAIFNAFNTTMPGFIYNVMAPTLNAADSLPFAIIATLLVHFFGSLEFMMLLFRNIGASS